MHKKLILSLAISAMTAFALSATNIPTMKANDDSIESTKQSNNENNAYVVNEEKDFFSLMKKIKLLPV